MNETTAAAEKHTIIGNEDVQVQFPLVYASDQDSIGRNYKHHKVQNTQAAIRKLHDDLNSALYSSPTERPTIQSPRDVFAILQFFLAVLDHEGMWVMLLDTRNRVMNLVQLYKGNVNCSQVRICEVFRQAIMDNAPSIIVAHNHPSGDPTPSHEDIVVTRVLVQAVKLLNIAVLDHIVISDGRYVSVKEAGFGFSTDT